MKESIIIQSDLSFRKIVYSQITACFLLITVLTGGANVSAQQRVANYSPCFLADNVDKQLVFIQQYAWKIFTDTASCKGALLDTLATRFITTKDSRYLQTLSVIRQNKYAHVDEFYTDIVSRFIQDDFPGFLQQLYIAHGKMTALETEMIAALNMIVNGRTMKQKYMGLLNVEIGKAKDAKDVYKTSYLEKLKTRIETEKY